MAKGSSLKFWSALILCSYLFVLTVSIVVDRSYAETALTSDGITWQYTVEADGAHITGCNFGSKTAITIPGTLGGNAVVAIGNAVFKDKTTLTSVNLSQCTELKTIGIYAFYGCDRLTSVDFSSCVKLQEFYQGAFYHCDRLQTVNFNNCNDLTIVGCWAFGRCVALTSVDLSGHSNLREIGATAFQECSALQSANFSGCTNLETVGTRAFYSCVNLNTVNFSNCGSLSEIQEQAFREDVKLANLTLSEGLKTIGANAFERCLVLNSLTLPYTIESIGSVAFGGDLLNGNNGVLDLSNRQNLKSIAFGAFQYTSMKSVNLSGCKKLESIGTKAFYWCPFLVNANLSGCTSLKTLVANTFEDDGSTLTLNLSGCTALASFEAGAFPSQSIVIPITEASMTVNPVKGNDLAVTGTADTAGSTVTVKNSQSQVLGTATSGIDGTYRVGIAIQPVGSILTISVSPAIQGVSANVTVGLPNNNALEKPSVDPVYENSTAVMGRAKPFSVITVKKGNTLLGTAPVNAGGSFNVTISPQPKDTILQISVTDVSSQASTESVTVAGVTATSTGVSAPTVDFLYSNSVAIKGTAEARSVVTVKNSAGTILGVGTAGVDGKFSIAITSQVPGTLVQVNYVNAANQTSAATIVRVFTVDQTLLTTPSVNAVASNATAVTGKADLGCVVTIRKTNGTLVGSGAVAADGSFRVIISAQTSGTVLVLTASDALGKTSEAANVTVVASDLTKPMAPKVNQVASNMVAITGVSKAFSTITVKNCDDQVMGTGIAGSDGIFRVVCTNRTYLVVGTTFKVIASDVSGNVGLTEVSVFSPDYIKPLAPTVNQVDCNTIVVTGNTEPFSAVTVKNGIGSILGTIIADHLGLFHVSVAPQNMGSVMSVTAKDASDNESDSKTVTVSVINGDVPVVNPVTSNATAVTGRTLSMSIVTVKRIDGTILGTGTALEDGGFRISVDKQPVGRVLVITNKSQTNQVGMNEVTVTAADTVKPEVPEVNPVLTGDTAVTGKAEPYSVVSIKNGQGSALGSAMAGADGVFNVVVASQVLGEILSATAEDASGNESTSWSGTVLKRVNVQPVASNAKYVIGTSDVGATMGASVGASVSVKMGTTVLGTGTVGADGVYRIGISTPSQGTLVQGNVLRIIADQVGMNEVTVTAADTVKPEVPEVNPVLTGDTAVTGKAEPYSVVSIKNGQGTVLGSVMAGADGVFSVVIAPQASGVKLSVAAEDASGNESLSWSGAELKQLDVQPVASNAKYVIGTSGAGATMGTTVGATVSVKMGTTVLGTGTVGADGVYRIGISMPSQGTLVQGNVLRIIADQVGMNEVTVTAADTVKPEVPEVNTVLTGDTAVTGKAEPYSVVSIKNGQGTVLGSIMAGADGVFNVVIAPQASGVKLSVAADDASGNESTSWSGTVLKQLDVQPVANNAKYVIGTSDVGTTMGTTVSVKMGTKVLGTGTVGADGVYRIAISMPSQGTLVQGNMLKVTVSNSTGAVIAVGSASVTDVDSTLPSIHLLNPVLDHATVVTGKAEPHSFITVSNDSNIILGTATAGIEGEFSVMISSWPSNGNLSLVATDASENQSKVWHVSVRLAVDKKDHGDRESVSVISPEIKVGSESNKSYVSGYADKKFHPERQVTRAELAIMLVKILSLDESNTNKTESADRQEGLSQIEAIQKIVNLGLLSGYPNGALQPEKPLTRAELATVISKYWDLAGVQVNSSDVPLKDVAGHWAHSAINRVYNAGLSKGFKGNLYKPDELVNREQVIVMLNKLIGRHPVKATKASFTDVATDYWAFGDIEAAYQGVIPIQ